MRRNQDPLERYLWTARYKHYDFRPEYLTYEHAALHSLAAFLDRPPADVRATAEPGEYPRVVDSQGTAPFQYRWQQEEWADE